MVYCPLTTRQVQIIRYLWNGLTTEEIASRLFVSAKTVQTHKETIFRKAGVHNIAGLFRWAIDCGVIRIAGDTKPQSPTAG